MNEQLVVKNFGPIKDATVDFKRVTVFIGPTGGGKSTLAKLAAVFRDDRFLALADKQRLMRFKDLSIEKYFQSKTNISWQGARHSVNTTNGLSFPQSDFDTKAFERINNRTKTKVALSVAEMELMLELIQSEQALRAGNISVEEQADKEKELGRSNPEALEKVSEFLATFHQESLRETPSYFPSERIFVSSIEYSWSGLLRDDIGLPKTVLDFANKFSISRRDVQKLDIPLFKIQYIHRSGQDFIKVPGVKTLFRLYETASGIQSVTPMLVLLEHLSRDIEQAQSFIIEEPELNLYPEAQQGLLNWLVEKCTKGENDLTITTHSPYILSSCNLLLEAYKVAQLRPELADEIDKIVPRACWLNPDEFAAYYVADGTVRPITDERTHLIGGNELDAVSGDISDSFRRLLQLKKQVA